DAGHGRARHERGVQPGRPNHRAGVRPGDRDRRAGAHPQQRGGAGSLPGHLADAFLSTAMAEPFFVISDLHAYYGKSHVLHGVDLHVRKGEIVSLLGRNGVGRSTTIKAAMGMVSAEGSVRFQDQELLGRKPYEIAHLGLGYVPESRDIFPTLTVEQNLLLGMKGSKAGSWSFDDMYRMFPRLEERRNTAAGVLSGGEQQMLTLCRTLMGDPELIMIDEPTEGLAPKI